MKRTKEDAQETRERIFRAGVRVFARKGYAGATLNDVACEAGVTRGAIYWHFRNKEAFFEETVTRLNSSYDQLIDGALSTSREPADTIAATVEELIRRFARDEEFRAMQELVIRTSIAGRTRLCDGSRPIDRNDEAAVRLLEQAMERRALFDGWSPELALRTISAVIGGIFLMILDGQLTPTDTDMRHIAAFVRRGIAPERSPV